MIEEIKIKIQKAIESIREFRDTHSLDITCSQYHTGCINGLMRALKIINEVENNDKNK